MKINQKFVSLAELARLANICEPRLRRILSQNGIAESQTVGRVRLFDIRQLDDVKRAIAATRVPAEIEINQHEAVC